jgi:hypothetical protein
MPALAGIDSAGAILHNSDPAVAIVRHRAAIPIAAILQLDKVTRRAN